VTKSGGNTFRGERTTTSRAARCGRSGEAAGARPGDGSSRFYVQDNETTRNSTSSAARSAARSYATGCSSTARTRRATAQRRQLQLRDGMNGDVPRNRWRNRRSAS
jgi:hypothetical protein